MIHQITNTRPSAKVHIAKPRSVRTPSSSGMVMSVDECIQILERHRWGFGIIQIWNACQNCSWKLTDHILEVCRTLDTIGSELHIRAFNNIASVVLDVAWLSEVVGYSQNLSSVFHALYHYSRIPVSFRRECVPVWVDNTKCKGKLLRFKLHRWNLPYPFTDPVNNRSRKWWMPIPESRRYMLVVSCNWFFQRVDCMNWMLWFGEQLHKYTRLHVHASPTAGGRYIYGQFGSMWTPARQSEQVLSTHAERNTLPPAIMCFTVCQDTWESTHLNRYRVVFILFFFEFVCICWESTFIELFNIDIHVHWQKERSMFLCRIAWSLMFI